MYYHIVWFCYNIVIIWQVYYSCSYQCKGRRPPCQCPRCPWHTWRRSPWYLPNSHGSLQRNTDFWQHLCCTPAHFRPNIEITIKDTRTKKNAHKYCQIAVFFKAGTSFLAQSTRFCSLSDVRFLVLRACCPSREPVAKKCHIEDCIILTVIAHTLTIGQQILTLILLTLLTYIDLCSDKITISGLDWGAWQEPIVHYYNKDCCS